MVTPVVNMASLNVKAEIVEACESMGVFKLINHGIPLEAMTGLEGEVVKFFSLPQVDKDLAGPGRPYGYGSKRIGPNGDEGWIEHLLLSTDLDSLSMISPSICPEQLHNFGLAAERYVSSVRNVAYDLLELMAQGLSMEPTDSLSALLRDPHSDSCFRVNHYPRSSQFESAENFIGFGEHTDPQIISVLWSNNGNGFEVCKKDGSWVSVPPDPNSFINVGDLLQVITNGRFKSVRHRVVTDGSEGRLSIIYFGGPPLEELIAPSSSLCRDGEDSLYEEFTWHEYKKCTYKLRLGDDRLSFFERKM